MRVYTAIIFCVYQIHIAKLVDQLIFRPDKYPPRKRVKKPARAPPSVSEYCESTLYLDSNLEIYKKDVQKLFEKYGISSSDFSFFTFKKDIDCEFCGKYFKSNLWKNYHVVHAHIGNRIKCNEKHFGEYEAEALRFEGLTHEKRIQQAVCLGYFYDHFAKVKSEKELQYSPEKATLKFCGEFDQLFKDSNVSMITKTLYMLAFCILMVILAIFVILRILIIVL